MSAPPENVTGPRPAREVTDEELDQAARRVRRHVWRERGAMGAGMLVGFAGVAGWFALGTVLVFVGSLLVGGLVYRALRPRGGPLDDHEPGPVDPEARRAGGGMHARGLLGWLGSHVLVEVVSGIGVVGGIVLGLFFPGKLLGEQMNNPLQGMLVGAAIAAGVLGLLGLFLGRALARRVFPRAQSPFG
ncbi:MAG: hypothetical protein IT373_21005 [Polyangiaceae bacterium]|nr:hypothetical protein [Polyangiaceae bacterium]